MNEITKTVQQAAASLLQEGRVDMVLGFKPGSVPMACSPFIARRPEQADLFVWNNHCGLNLANYLTGRQEKIGIIAKGCDTRNIVNHMVENKIERDQLYIIGVPCTGMVDRAKIAAQIDQEIIGYSEQGEMMILTTRLGTTQLLKKDYLKPNCLTCMHPNPVIHDRLAAEPVPEPVIENPFFDVDEIQAKSLDERWAYFDDLLENCIRCYACRNACPLCYCPTCFVDESAPQWVGKGMDPEDIRTFHFLRAYHCAGRCTDCGACVQACPMDIDVRAFTRKLNKDSFEIYGWEPGLDPEKRPPLDTFSPDDSDHFIR